LYELFGFVGEVLIIEMILKMLERSFKKIASRSTTHSKGFRWQGVIEMFMSSISLVSNILTSTAEFKELHIQQD